MRVPVLRGIYVLPLLITGLRSGILAAQAPPPSASWQLKPTVTVLGESDDNPFLLTPNQRTRLASGTTASPPSRYANMENPSDVLTKVRAELEIQGPGLAGRDVVITPELGYDYYAWNGERSAPKFGLTVAQNLRRGSRIRFQAEMTPSTFFKNYLTNAIDANADGSIATSERLYAPGNSTERVLSLDYRARLKKGRGKSPTSVYAQLGAGHAAETYAAPFAVRDRAGLTGALKIIVDRGRTELEAGYDIAAMKSSPGRAVRLLDEPNFGVDFNGNGNTTDLSARAFELVDYSRTEHVFSAGGRLPVGKRTTLALELEHRRRSFGSKQQYDVSNNGRADSRNSIDLGATIKLVPSLRLIAGVELQKQVVNKALDTVGEVSDYSRRRATLGMTYIY